MLLKNNRGTLRTVGNASLILLLSVMIFYMLSTNTVIRCGTADRPEAIVNHNFSEDMLRLEISCFSFYPDALLAPEDFASGKAPETLLTALDEKRDDTKTEYATYRAVFHVPAGHVYGILGMSPSYSETMWVDGKPAVSIGQPADNVGDTVTAARRFAVFFEARGQTEIVIQRSNFHHFDEGILPILYLGRQEDISTQYAKDQVWGSVMIGCMLLAFLFFSGIFLFFSRRLQYLWFSLSCLCIAVRTSLVHNKLIMLLFPNLSWVVGHKIEYISTLLLTLFFILYINQLFHVPLKHPVNLVSVCFCAGGACFVLFAPSILFTQYLYLYQCIVLLLFAASLVNMIRNRDVMMKETLGEFILFFMGLVVLAVLAFIDVIRHNNGGFYLEINLMQTGMIAFVIANILSLILNLTRTETQLEQARREQAELDEANRLLDRLNAMKTEFLSNISHEMKTPLAVMSVNAQVSGTLLEIGESKEEINRNLSVIADEAERLSRLVNGMLTLGSLQEGNSEMRRLDLSDLLRNICSTYQVLLQKQENRFRLEVASGLTVYGSGDMLVQVMINLLSNANRHTHRGTIAVAAKDSAGEAVVMVTDDGTGISPDRLQEVLERRVTDGSGMGIGLSICREILEKHGGSLDLQSVEGRGTTVTWRIPLYQEKTHD